MFVLNNIHVKRIEVRKALKKNFRIIIIITVIKVRICIFLPTLLIKELPRDGPLLARIKTPKIKLNQICLIMMCFPPKQRTKLGAVLVTHVSVILSTMFTMKSSTTGGIYIQCSIGSRREEFH